MVRKEQQLDKNLMDRRRTLRAIFGTPAGRAYVAEDLKRSGLFDRIGTQEEVMRHNLMVDRLDEAGLLDEESLKGYVDWLFSQPLAYKDPVEDEE